MRVDDDFGPDDGVHRRPAGMLEHGEKMRVVVSAKASGILWGAAAYFRRLSSARIGLKHLGLDHVF
jgi:hypothetical protein